MKDSYDELNDVERRPVGLESFDADLEAVAEGGLARLAALQRKREGDVAGAAMECDRPPHLSLVSLSLYIYI